MKLIIVRHGETEHNKTRTHMGVLDMPLNDRGLDQAALVGGRLRNERIDAVYSSDLSRALVTAEQIAKAHNLSVVVDPLLRERNVGELAGTPILPSDMIVHPSKSFDRSYRPVGGESYEDVRARAERWIHQVRTKHRDETIVMVGHGFFLYTLLGACVYAGAEEDERKEFLLKNASVTVLDVPAIGAANILHLNDIGHLPTVSHEQQ